MSRIEPRPADYREYGSVTRSADFDIDWAALYEQGDSLTQQLQKDYEHDSNMLYGDSPYQIIDLYHPRDAVGEVPLIVFMHGGAFREGHPHHYGFLARPYLEAGVAFASIGYRLMPELEFPDTVNDVVLALTWMHANLGARGIDTDQIFLGGHSAGAMIAALLAVRDDWQGPAGLPQDIIKGNILVSGYYDFREDFPGNHILDPNKRVFGSPLCNVQASPRSPAPTIISYGPTELNWKPQIPGHYADSSDEFARALVEAGSQVEVVQLHGADHDDTAIAVGDPHSPLTAAILKMVAGVSAGANRGGSEKSS